MVHKKDKKIQSDRTKGTENIFKENNKLTLTWAHLRERIILHACIDSSAIFSKTKLVVGVVEDKDIVLRVESSNHSPLTSMIEISFFIIMEHGQSHLHYFLTR